jgi:hypothetical protein
VKWAIILKFFFHPYVGRLNTDGRGGRCGVYNTQCRQLRFKIGTAFFHIVFELTKAFLFTLQSLYLKNSTVIVYDIHLRKLYK